MNGGQFGLCLCSLRVAEAGAWPDSGGCNVLIDGGFSGMSEEARGVVGDRMEILY